MKTKILDAVQHKITTYKKKVKKTNKFIKIIL